MTIRKESYKPYGNKYSDSCELTIEDRVAYASYTRYIPLKNGKYKKLVEKYEFFKLESGETEDQHAYYFNKKSKDVFIEIMQDFYIKDRWAPRGCDL